MHKKSNLKHSKILKVQILTILSCQKKLFELIYANGNPIKCALIKAVKSSERSMGDFLQQSSWKN